MFLLLVEHKWDTKLRQRLERNSGSKTQAETLNLSQQFSFIYCIKPVTDQSAAVVH